jgi:PST family polysaccharide transporter
MQKPAANVGEPRSPGESRQSFGRRALARLLGRGIVGNAVSLYAVQGLNYLVPLLLLPYLLRVLSPEGYGSIAFAQSIMGYAIIVTEFGFNLTATRDISVARDNPATVAKIYWTTLAAKTLLLVTSMIIVALVILAVPVFRRQWPIFAASSVLLVGNVAFPQWYLQGLERLREVAVIQAVAKCLVACSTVLLVRRPQDTWIAALIMSSPQLLGAAAALCLRKPLAPASFYRPTARDIITALRHSSHMFASIVSTTLFLHTNTLVLGLMCGDRQVALYSLGMRLVAALQSVTSPIVQAVFPRASLLFAEQPAQAWALLKRAAMLVVPAMALASLLIAIFAPAAVRLLGGHSYAGAVTVVRIMAAIPLLVTIAAGLSQTIMVNSGLTKQLVRIYVAVGCLNLLLLPLLVVKFAANGAAAALLVAETLGPILMVRALWRDRMASRGVGA